MSKNVEIRTQRALVLQGEVSLDAYEAVRLNFIIVFKKILMIMRMYLIY